MKIKSLNDKSKGSKLLTVRKTLIKNTNSNPENQNINKDNKSYTKITINKSLLWKEQDRIKLEKNQKPKTDFKRLKRDNFEFTKITTPIKKVIENKPNNKIQIGIRKQSNLIISPKMNNNYNNNNEKNSNSFISTNQIKKNLYISNSEKAKNYRFLLHHVSKNLNKTFSNLYEANNRSYSSPTNSFNGNLNKSGNDSTNSIFSNKKELNNLGYNINNQNISLNKSKSNSNFKEVFKNKIYENQIEKNTPNTAASKNDFNNFSLDSSFDFLNNSCLLQNYQKRFINNCNQNSRNVSQDKSINESNNNNSFNSDYNNLNNLNFNNNNNNEISDFNIEQIFILESKLKDILQKLNSYQSCYNESFEWINFYFNSNLCHNLINLCKDSNNRKLMTYTIKIELLCYCLCYHISYDDRHLNKVIILLKSIFEQIHFNFLVLIRFILHKTKMTYDNYVWYEKLYNTVKSELSMNLSKNDLDEHNIMQIINHNIKTITNYFKIIIDNIYAPSYHPNIRQYKFPLILTNQVDGLKNKKEIISSFFFDSFAFPDNYTIEDIEKFFNLFLYKVSDPNGSYILSYKIKFTPDNGLNTNIINNHNSPIKIQQPLYYLPKLNTNLYRFTLVLDLDETLIYVKKENKNKTLIIRPYLYEFLSRMKSLYELILFSFGTPEYVDPIVNILEKKEKYFEYRLYRQHASLSGNDYVKDLSKLGRDLKKVIIIDNMPQAFKLNKFNGICIKAFYGDTVGDRNTLKVLSEILERIRYDAEETNDIRYSLRKEMNLIITKITSNVD